MSLFKSVKIINSGKAILLSRKHGTPLRYHSTWLRDNSLVGSSPRINIAANNPVGGIPIVTIGKTLYKGLFFKT